MRLELTIRESGRPCTQYCSTLAVIIFAGVGVGSGNELHVSSTRVSGRVMVDSTCYV